MKAVHMNMPIDYDTFNRFNSLFIGALRRLGVTSADASMIGSFLASFAPNIVNPRTLCGKYSSALGLSEVQFMITVITNVVKTELKDPSILPFFNGQVPAGSINFLTNKTQFDRLAGNLVAYFGGALGCTRNFPAYRGNPSMQQVHARMPITDMIFSNFNNNLQNTAANLGFGMGDQLTLRFLLDSFQKQIVNTPQ